jgi:hypothetical protein
MALPQSKTANAHRSLYVNRRLLLLGLVLAGNSGGPGEAQQATPSAEAMLGRAVGDLRREKTAAEAYAEILATVGKADTGSYVRGILLYAVPRRSLTP